MDIIIMIRQEGEEEVYSFPHRGRGVELAEGAGVIAVIGAAAACNASAPTVPNWGWPPSAGCLCSGGGSGSVAASRVTPILSALRARAAIAGRCAAFWRHTPQATDWKSSLLTNGACLSRRCYVCPRP